ncbi:MAG: hypothetical protein FD171_2155 [Actinobacteria bacterium]|nr:MAG: hypothetical protein FD171_2155 [Actinomycetota bacterium]
MKVTRITRHAIDRYIQRVEGRDPTQATRSERERVAGVLVARLHRATTHGKGASGGRIVVDRDGLHAAMCKQVVITVFPPDRPILGCACHTCFALTHPAGRVGYTSVLARSA